MASPAPGGGGGDEEGGPKILSWARAGEPSPQQKSCFIELEFDGEGMVPQTVEVHLVRTALAVRPGQLEEWPRSERTIITA